MSVDPDVMETGQPYSDGSDDPANVTDPAGDSSVPIVRFGPGQGCRLYPCWPEGRVPSKLPPVRQISFD